MKSKKQNFLRILVFVNILLFVILVKIPMGYGTNHAPGFSTELLHSAPQEGVVKIGYFKREELYDKLKYMKEIEKVLSEQVKAMEAQIEAKTKEIMTWESTWPEPDQLLPSEKRRFDSEVLVYQQEYEQLMQQLQMEFQTNEYELMKKLAEQTERAAETYAIANGFDFVLSYELGGSMCYGSKKHDITKELAEVMNKAYKGK